MAVDIKTLDCNGGCGACYENRIRKANPQRGYDIEKIVESLKREMDKDPNNQWNTPVLHGGEPLLMKVEDIERLLSMIFDKYKKTGIQTNLTLLNDKHIELFKKYKTNVGVSLDGDTAELNFGRWNLCPDKAEEMTELTIQNLFKLKENGISISMICVLRKYNSDKNHILDFIGFLDRMEKEFGVKDFRCNDVGVYEEDQRPLEELDDEELGDAFIKILEYKFSNPEISIQPVNDVVNMFMGHPNDSTCLFQNCDPYYTTSEMPILGDGDIGNCLKTGSAIDGLASLRADKLSNIRSNILFNTPQELLGCKDCHYWEFCKGGCSGKGEGNDWRNRTRSCGGYKIFFAHIENILTTLMPNLVIGVNALESISGSTWARNKRKTFEVKPQQPQAVCGNRPHGDKPHGDHYDAEGRK